MRLSMILIAGLAVPAAAQDGLPVQAPARMVPAQAACVKAADGTASCPPALPTSDANEAPFSGAAAMTVGSTYPARRSIAANCSAGGAATIRLADASTVAVTLGVGWQTFPFAATAIVSTTGTCSFSELS